MCLHKFGLKCGADEVPNCPIDTVFSLVSTIFVLSLRFPRHQKHLNCEGMWTQKTIPIKHQTHLKRYLPRDSLKKHTVFSLSPDQINNFFGGKTQLLQHVSTLVSQSSKGPAVKHRNGWRWFDDRRPVLLKENDHNLFLSCMGIQLM